MAKKVKPQLFIHLLNIKFRTTQLAQIHTGRISSLLFLEDTQMKALIFTIAALIAVGYTFEADASSIGRGLDQQGRPCTIELDSLQIGPVVLQDACTFEKVGRGPWCENKSPVVTRSVVGSGSLATADGSVAFTIHDDYAIFGTSSASGSGTGADGRVLTFAFPNSRVMQASYTFMTAYGKTLSPAQIGSVLYNRPNGESYDSIFGKIYTRVTCTAQF
jgi:hypothetical protein